MFTKELTYYERTIPERWKHREAMYAELLSTDGAGAELGVKHGDNAKALMEAANPKLIYLVDRWRGLPNPRELEGGKKFSKKQESRFGYVKERFANPIKQKTAVVLRSTTEDAAYAVEDGSLDWLYIDANHRYAAVLLDIQLWVPKLKKNGIIMLHDFTEKISDGGVIEAVYYEMRDASKFLPLGKTARDKSRPGGMPSAAYKKLF